MKKKVSPSTITWMLKAKQNKIATAKTKPKQEELEKNWELLSITSLVQCQWEAEEWLEVWAGEGVDGGIIDHRATEQCLRRPAKWGSP